MIFMYMQVLTKEQAAESLENDLIDANNWWCHLNQDDNIMLYKMYKDLLKQLHCDHDYHSMKYYDEMKEYCIHCNLKK